MIYNTSIARYYDLQLNVLPYQTTCCIASYHVLNLNILSYQLVLPYQVELRIEAGAEDGHQPQRIVGILVLGRGECNML